MRTHPSLAAVVSFKTPVPQTLHPPSDNVFISERHTPPRETAFTPVLTKMSVQLTSPTLSLAVRKIDHFSEHDGLETRRFYICRIVENTGLRNTSPRHERGPPAV